MSISNCCLGQCGARAVLVSMMLGTVWLAAPERCLAQASTVERFNSEVASTRGSGEAAVLQVYARMRPELYAEASRCQAAECVPAVWSALTVAQGLMDWDKVTALCDQGVALQPDTMSKLSWQAVQSSSLVRRAELEHQPALAAQAGAVIRDALAPVWMELGAGRLTLNGAMWQHVLSMVSQQARAWELAGDFPAAAASATLASQIADSRRGELAEAPAALMPDEFLRRAALAHARMRNVDQATASLLGIDLLTSRRKDAGFHVLLMLDDASKSDRDARESIHLTVDRWIASRAWDARTPQVIVKRAALELAGSAGSQDRMLTLIRKSLDERQQLVSDADAQSRREAGADSPNMPEWERRAITFGLWNLRMELATSLGKHNEARAAAETLVQTFGVGHPASTRGMQVLGQ